MIMQAYRTLLRQTLLRVTHVGQTAPVRPLASFKHHLQRSFSTDKPSDEENSSIAQSPQPSSETTKGPETSSKAGTDENAAGTGPNVSAEGEEGQNAEIGENVEDDLAPESEELHIPPVLKAPHMAVRTRMRLARKADPTMERIARRGDMAYPLFSTLELTDDAFQEWRVPQRIEKIGRLYGVFQDLFNKHFLVDKNLAVEYGGGYGVHYGNIMTPSMMLEHPTINFDIPESGPKFSVAMFDLDARMDGQPGQLVHWMIGNISHEAPVDDTNTVVPYMPPIPLENTGVHRIAFALLQQNKGDINVESVLGHTSLDKLEDRYVNFAKVEKELGLFCKGLAFCQVAFDESVPQVFEELFGNPPPEFPPYEPLKADVKIKPPKKNKRN